MSIGIFQIVKNEAQWIGPWLMSFLPHVDQFSIYDGNSNDGTLDIINHVAGLPGGDKIKLRLGIDPDVKTEEYTTAFDCCMRELDTDLAAFIHPDMFPVNPETLGELKGSKAVALYSEIESFGGEPGGELFRFESGRAKRWKNIYRLKNPDLGAHYHGLYGAANEDVYFSEITGSEHEFFGDDFERYPYRVEASGLRLLHYSDVRSRGRRVERMIRCLMNRGHDADYAISAAMDHPRVTLKDGYGFSLVESDYPAEWKKWDNYFARFKKGEMANV